MWLCKSACSNDFSILVSTKYPKMTKLAKSFGVLTTTLLHDNMMNRLALIKTRKLRHVGMQCT